jgi:NitT/TauT family transport system substrate-binding protein
MRTQTKGAEVKRSRWYLVGLVAAAVTVIAGCTSSGGGTSAGGSSPVDAPTTVRVASDANAGALPVWVALDKGFFAKHGIDVKYSDISDVGTLPPQLGKTFDIAYVTPTAAVAATSMGIPVTEVAGGYTATEDNPASWLMVKKGSNITSLSQLKGKTIGALTVAGTLNYATLNMLSTAGVSQSSVKIIAVSPVQQSAQLEAGRVDAVETVEPFHQQILATGGTSIGEPYKSMTFPLSAIWWGANPDWASQHASVVTAFRASLTDAIQFIHSNDSEARAILEKYTKLPTAVIEKYPFPDYDPAVRPDDIPKWISVMKQFANFTGSVDPSKLTFQP